MTIDIQDIADDVKLQEKLHSMATSRNVRDVEVACWHDGKLRRAAILRSAITTAESDMSYRAKVGCIAKSITATLIAHASAEGKLQLTDNVADVLQKGRPQSERETTLSALRIMDLLNHTHGLDDSLASSPMRGLHEFIDFEKLRAEVLNAPPLHGPGEYFSYSAAGAWLAVAILEKLYEEPYAVLLQRKLFNPLGVSAWVGEKPLVEALENGKDPHLPAKLAAADSKLAICPAMGGELRMSATGLVNLYRSHLPLDEPQQGAVAKSLESLRQNRFEPRCWQSMARMVGLGVNDFGGDWFGHNTIYRNESAAVRFHPESKTVIAVTSSHEMGAVAMLAKVFGSGMPEFSRKEIPQLLTAAQWAQTPTNDYVGTYENAAMKMVVDTAANKLLRVRVFLKNNEHEPYIKRYLRPAADNVFFSNPSEQLLVPYLQFLDLEKNGGYRYIQNGRQMFIRMQ